MARAGRSGSASGRRSSPARFEAFRDHDAPAALSFAGEEFHKTFPDPEDFFIAIISSGYSPIMESQSHTFGPYQMVAPDQVLQEVKLTGNDQKYLRGDLPAQQGSRRLARATACS